MFLYPLLSTNCDFNISRLVIHTDRQFFHIHFHLEDTTELIDVQVESNKHPTLFSIQRTNPIKLHCIVFIINEINSEYKTRSSIKNESESCWIW